MRKYLKSMCAILAVLMCCVFVPPAFAAVPEEADVASGHVYDEDVYDVIAEKYRYYDNDNHVRSQTRKYRCTICGESQQKVVETLLIHRLDNGTGKFQYTTLGPNGETIYVYQKRCADCGGYIKISTTTPPN